MMPSIVPLASRHIPEVARLHLCHLSTGFSGLPGQKLLQAYYTAVAGEVGACGYVAEMDGQVAGYICGVWAPSMIRAAVLNSHWLELWFWGVAQAVVRPRFAGSVLNRFRYAKRSSALSTSGYELRPIVVAPSAQGSGAASQLVTALLMDAGRRGFQDVYLVVEVDNARAHAFYRKAGFCPAGTIQHLGVAHVRYQRSVGEVV